MVNASLRYHHTLSKELVFPCSAVNKSHTVTTRKRVKIVVVWWSLVSNRSNPSEPWNNVPDPTTNKQNPKSLSESQKSCFRELLVPQAQNQGAAPVLTHLSGGTLFERGGQCYFKSGYAPGLLGHWCMMGLGGSVLRTLLGVHDPWPYGDVWPHTAAGQAPHKVPCLALVHICWTCNSQSAPPHPCTHLLDGQLTKCLARPLYCKAHTSTEQDSASPMKIEHSLSGETSCTVES